MATYKDIRNYVKKKYGYSVKTCWIAHVKEMCGHNPRIAPNRYSTESRENPCPNDKIDSIKDSFSHFGMI